MRLIFGGAFLWRIFAINQSFWLDEAISANVAKMSFSQILTQFAPTDFHPPLYYLLIKVWSICFTNSEISLRLFSTFAILIGGYFVYLAANRLRGGWGEWAAIFFLFNPLLVYYSHEARMYGLNVMFLAMTTYFWLNLYLHRLKQTPTNISPNQPQARHFFHQCQIRLQTIFNNLPTHPHLPDSSDLLWFNVCAALSIMTFYGSVFYLAALIIITMSVHKWQSCLKLIFGPVFAIVILTPLLLLQMEHASKMTALVPNWKSVLGLANGKNLFLLLLKMTSGRISFDPKIVYVFLASLWALFVAWIAIINWRRSQLFWGIILTVVSLSFVASSVVPMFSYFRLLYLVIPLALILSEESRVYFREVLLVFFLIWGGVYLFSPHQHRENWRSLAKSITQNEEILMVQSASDPMKYYLPDAKIIDFKLIDTIDKKQEKIVVIPYVVDIHAIEYRQALTQKGFQLESEKSFHLLKKETWSKITKNKINPNSIPPKYRKL